MAETPVDREIEAALQKIEAQIFVIRDLQSGRKRATKAAATRRRNAARAKA